jgi:hypothetical protein
MTAKSLYPTVRPTLNLDFAKAKVLDPRITFTRASSATYVGSNRELKTASTNVPRFDYNPSTGESLGLLVEEARTNLMAYSEQLNDILWGPVAGTVTPNAETSPANTLTADKLIAANGGPQGQLAQAATITSGATVTASVYAKAGGFDRFEIVLLASSNTTPYGRSTFNPNTGAITTPAFTSNGGTNASSVVQALSNGWYRFSVTVTYPAVTAAGLRLVVTNSDAANGDGVKGVFLWGAQLEAGSFATSYIPTTSATVTRAADVASITGTNFSSWYNQTEGTVFAEGAVTQPASGGNQFVFRASDNSFNNQVALNIQGSGAASIATAAGGVIDGTATSVLALSANTAAKFTGAYATNNLGMSLNGATVVADTSATMPTALNRLDIGSDHSGTNRVKAGTIKRLTYYPVRLPDATLQAITIP